jgi:hypothetical protein
MVEPAPKDFQITPETEEPIENMKNFEAVSKENIKHKISIFKQGDNVIIQAEIEKGFQKYIYYNSYTLDSLKYNNNLFFSLIDDINNVIDTIYQNATIFSSTIYESNNSYVLKIPVSITNIKEITFILTQKKKIEKNEGQEKLNKLYKKVNEYEQKLEEKMKVIECQNKKLEEQNFTIDEQKLIIEKLTKIKEKIEKEQNQTTGELNEKNEIQKIKFEKLNIKIENPNNIMNLETKKPINELLPIEEELETKKEEQNKLMEDRNKKLDFQLNINKTEENKIKNFQEKDKQRTYRNFYLNNETIVKPGSFRIINNWINRLKKLDFELLYKASINGDCAENFHKNCDGYYPTVTIIKSKNNNIFGGYISVPFLSIYKPFLDETAFLFSLTKNQKFRIKNKEFPVSNSRLFGPHFGINDLRISSHCLSKASFCKPRTFNFDTINLIGINDKNFEVEDYEVYLVN